MQFRIGHKQMIVVIDAIRIIGGKGALHSHVSVLCTVRVIEIFQLLSILETEIGRDIPCFVKHVVHGKFHMDFRVSRYCPWQQSSSMSTKNHSAPVEKEGQVFYSS